MFADCRWNKSDSATCRFLLALLHKNHKAQLMIHRRLKQKTFAMGKRSNPTFIEFDFVDFVGEGQGPPGKRRHVSSQFAAIALLSIRAPLSAQPRQVSATVKPVKDILQKASSITNDECDDCSLVQSYCIKDFNLPVTSSQPPPIGLALHRPVLALAVPKTAPKDQNNMISKLPLGRPLPPAPPLSPRHLMTHLKPINLSLQPSK